MSRLSRYGPRAVVAGASEGIGAAFASALAAGGLDVVLAARRREPLEDLAARLPTRSVVVPCDLSTDAGVDTLLEACAGVEVGLVVCNAAFVPIGRFLDRDEADLRRAVDVNCVAPLRLARGLLPPMVARGRGGFIVMSSLAGLQGSPPISIYAATKAFGAVLGEGLWAELRGTGVDVLTCVAGAVETPNLSGTKTRRAPGTQPPAAVAAAAVRGLGHGPRVVPGVTAKISAAVMSRLLPRRTAIAVIARASQDLTPPT